MSEKAQEKMSVLDILKSKQKDGGYEEFQLPMTKEITVKMKFFTTDQALSAQKQAQSGDSVNEDLMYAAMMAESCEFNGEKLNPYQIKEHLHGIDYMFLLGKLSGVGE